MTGSRYTLRIDIGIDSSINIGINSGIDSHLGRGSRSRTQTAVGIGAWTAVWIEALARMARVRSAETGHSPHGSRLGGVQRALPHRIPGALAAQRSIARIGRVGAVPSVPSISPVHSVGSVGPVGSAGSIGPIGPIESTGTILNICPHTSQIGSAGASGRGDREGGGRVLEVRLGIGREKGGRSGARGQTMSSRSVPTIGVVGEGIVDTAGTIRANEGGAEGVKGRFGGRASRKWMVVIAGRGLRGTEKGIERMDCGRRRHEVGVGRSVFFHNVLQIGEGQINVGNWRRQTRTTCFRVNILGHTWELAKRTR